jgi:hypothetical protein
LENIEEDFDFSFSFSFSFSFESRDGLALLSGDPLGVAINDFVGEAFGIAILEVNGGANNKLK